MKKLLLFCVLMSTIFMQAQEETNNCKKEINKQIDFIKESNLLLKEKEKTFKKLTSEISVKTFKEELINNIKVKKQEIDKLKDTIYKTTLRAKSLKESCVLIEAITKEEIAKLFEDVNLDLNKVESEEPEETETQIYTYYGKDKVVKNDFIDKSTAQGKILADVLANKEEKDFLGTITVPKDNQELHFLKLKNTTKKASISTRPIKNAEEEKNRTNLEIDKQSKYKFKKLEVEIRDGSFADIRVTVSYKGNTHTFENHIGVSLSYFSTKAKNQILFYKQSKIINNKEFSLNELNSKFIRLSDVMNYKYEMGNHYIPLDLTVILPALDNEKKTNSKTATAYQIKQETYLDKIVEFRTYTDFLSLFGEGNNGLVSIEANAKFYVFPFPRQLFDWQAQWEFLPSVTTNVTYNRFEDGSKTVTIPVTDFTNDLDLIEKRFLTMGGNLNFLQFKHKSFPVKTTLYGTLNYQLTQASINNVLENAKGFSYGAGLGFSAKRFNNFGFNINVEYTKNDYKNSNTTAILQNKIPVIKGQAEVFYHPTKSPNQAVFARLSAYNHMGKGNNQAFYQFQFGYKFSIGSRTVKKQ